ncbi:lysM and putative peptidoglycan-binding domain-containing protein 2 isoform X1 [Columba livia]|uniref:lysM and putative peptidoglycan-binding domain-containing protein 2 isoform X1 n=1 Tax=Columba livia TaxID=8932 RepID=UPI0031BB8115
MAESLREEPPGGPESEAELSQRLAHTKARSYGSTASVAAPLAERYVEHRLSAGDTLQGIALKYGVTSSPPCLQSSFSGAPGAAS